MTTWRTLFPKRKWALLLDWSRPILKIQHEFHRAAHMVQVKEHLHVLFNREKLTRAIPINGTSKVNRRLTDQAYGQGRHRGLNNAEAAPMGFKKYNRVLLARKQFETGPITWQ